MDWKNILKATFKFKDIKFKKYYSGWYSRTQISNNLILSVVAGKGLYSHPKIILDDPMKYEQYEIAFMDNDENWMTKKVTNFDSDDVIPYRTKDEVEKYVQQALTSNSN